MKIEIVKAQSKDWELIQRLNNEVFINDSSHDDDLDLNWPFSEKGIKFYKKEGFYESGLELDKRL